ncbi:MAG: transposase [Chitinophagales bacterium]|nr:transposase [Chitinophagales bacterium]
MHNNMNLIAENLKYYAQKYELSILAYVIMPNHIHMILNFKRGSDRIAFMRDFKKFTSTQIRKEIELHEPEMLKKLFYTKGKQKFKIWQDRFDELFIISQDLFETKMQYIHNNPAVLSLSAAVAKRLIMKGVACSYDNLNSLVN